MAWAESIRNYRDAVRDGQLCRGGANVTSRPQAVFHRPRRYRFFELSACLRECLASVAACQSVHETSGAGRVADHCLSGLSVPGSSSLSATKRAMSAFETETDIA